MRGQIVLVPVTLLAMLLFTACPPSPVTPAPDADAMPAPAADDAGPAPAPSSFEAQRCAELGGPCGNDPACPAALAQNKIPGGYLTPWAACMYSDASAQSCAVPCKH